jgi:hypothetical protein
MRGRWQVDNREQYEPTAREAASRYNVPVEMFLRQITQESGWNPRAGSQAGAQGIAQIVPKYHPGVDPWNPVESLQYAAKLMRANYDQYGRWSLALAVYNAGGGAVQKYNGVPPYPETEQYLTVILGQGWPEPGAAPVDYTPVLNRVLELARAETGKPYTGPIADMPDSTRYGDPGYDCSSFVSEMYKRATQGQVVLPAYTDAIANACNWLASPVPGCIVVYHYPDPSQPNTYWPHVGLWLSKDETLDCRWGKGVGVHPHVTPVLDGERFRRTLLPKTLVPTMAPTPPVQPPSQADPLKAAQERITGLETALAHLADKVAGDSLQALRDEARAIREQFIGPRPA